MAFHLHKVFWLIATLSAICISNGQELTKSDVLQQQQQSAAASASLAQMLAPEPRQSVASSIGNVGAGNAGAVYPYNLYQNSVYGTGYNPAPSTTSSLLSLLRPQQGGRRSSLTSRLRNLMSAIFFRRETNTPYLGSGSSYSYAFRQPPFGYSSGLGSGFGSGLSASLSPSTQNLFSSASQYRPVVYSNYQGGSASPSNVWSNYKQWASGAGAGSSLPSSLTSQLSGSPSTNYGWSSSGSSGSSSYPGLSYGSNSGNSGSLGSGGSSYLPSSSSLGSGGTNYQAAASNSYPSTSYSSSYPSSSNSGGGGGGSISSNGYQRSSSASFKPVASNAYSVSSSVSSSSSNLNGNSNSYGSSSKGSNSYQTV